MGDPVNLVDMGGKCSSYVPFYDAYGWMGGMFDWNYQFIYNSLMMGGNSEAAMSLAGNYMNMCGAYYEITNGGANPNLYYGVGGGGYSVNQSGGGGGGAGRSQPQTGADSFQYAVTIAQGYMNELSSMKSFSDACNSFLQSIGVNPSQLIASGKHTTISNMVGNNGLYADLFKNNTSIYSTAQSLYGSTTINDIYLQDNPTAMGALNGNTIYLNADIFGATIDDYYKDVWIPGINWYSFLHEKIHNITGNVDSAFPDLTLKLYQNDCNHPPV